MSNLSDPLQGASSVEMSEPLRGASSQFELPPEDSDSFATVGPERSRRNGSALDREGSPTSPREFGSEGTSSRQSSSDLYRAFATASGELIQINSGADAFRGLLVGTKPQRAISDEREKVELKEICFDEENEGASRRPETLRRRVLPQSTIGWTKNCVVLDQGGLPDYLFTDLRLVDNAGALVTEVNYRDTEIRGQQPKIYYNGEMPEGGEATKFAHMISKNSYWNDLLRVLCKGGMLFAMTEYSHWTFMSTLPEEFDLNKGAEDTKHTGWDSILDFIPFGESPKRPMMFIVFTFIILRIGAAILSAQLEWKADDESGPDIIRSTLVPGFDEERNPQKFALRRDGKARAFVALVIFQLVGVPGVLRDLTNFLHPWKGLQPYAAFKADGARAFLLGFPSSALFRIENRPRHEVRYFLTFMQTILITLLKFVIRMKQWDDQIRCRKHPPCGMTNEKSIWVGTVIIDIAPGVLTVLINIVGAYRLHVDKRKCKEWLEDQMHSPDPKQQQVAVRLMAKHYGVTVSQRLRPDLDTSSPASRNWQAARDGLVERIRHGRLHREAPARQSDLHPQDSEQARGLGMAHRASETSRKPSLRQNPLADISSASLPVVDEAAVSSTPVDPGLNTKASGLDGNKMCAIRCAELARELQLWKVGVVFEDELSERGVDNEAVEKFLWALRDIAGPVQSARDKGRGPKPQ